MTKVIRTLFVTAVALAFSLPAAAAPAVILDGLSPYSLLRYQPDLSTRIYDRHGTLLYQLYDQENRLYVPLEEISPHLRAATLAIEDHRFYDHPGVDPIGILRAAKSTLIDGKIQGGSTLTQQYVKNAVLTSERTLARKTKEAALALILESTHSKDAILEKYLNEVPYGGVNYGVETAANYYFNKSASDLNLAESALLAALPKAPSNLSPRRDTADLIARQHLVLEAMQTHGFVTEAQKVQAQQEPLDFVFRSPPFLAPHYVMHVRQLLIDQYGQKAVLTGGLNVYTPLDLALQNYAQTVVAHEITQLQSFRVSNGAAIVMHPQTGDVLALIGSRNYFDTSIEGEFNVAFAYRQPGSTFKPFTYALAFEEGFTPATILQDTPTTYLTTQGDYRPVNYDGRFHGPVTIRQALGNSYNIPATRMLAVLGVNSLVTKAHDFGFDYLNPNRVGLSLTLGGNEVRPIDLAAAYTAFANHGKRADPIFIRNILDARGRTLFQAAPQHHQVIDSSVAYLISDILADNSARTQAFGPNSLLHLPNRKVAVKTGTTNSKRDNWTIGYTPSFLVAVWVGNNDDTPMGAVASGLTGASPIWRTITDYLFDHYPSQWLAQPSSIIQAQIDPQTGKKFCNQGQPVTEIFIQGTDPQECSRYQRILVEKRNNQEVPIENLSPEEHQQFQDDPLAFIEANRDKLQADDEPTPIYIKTTEQLEDPLTKLANSQQTINLAKLAR